MKERFLRFLYRKYTTYFYDFLVEEFLYDIPKDVREPAMTFLSQGKDRLEKWALFMSHLLQSRMTHDTDKVREYRGMMIMLKLLMIHVEAPTRVGSAPQTEEKKTDFSADVDSAVADLRKLSTDGPK